MSKKEESSEIYNLNIYLKKLPKEKQSKPKASQGKEIKIGAELKKIENGKITVNQ